MDQVLSVKKSKGIKGIRTSEYQNADYLDIRSSGKKSISFSWSPDVRISSFLIPLVSGYRDLCGLDTSPYLVEK